jgi:hypothetical protein
VRFPSVDIERATAAMKNRPSLQALIGALSETPVAHRSAPSTCLHCGEVLISRRKDARYCSRKCQLAGRDRCKKRQGEESSS